MMMSQCQDCPSSSDSGSSTKRRSFLPLALLLACAIVLPAQASLAATTKSPAIRLKRVNQALESIAGRARSARYLVATGEVAAGALYTFTGVGLVYGSVKYARNPN